MAENSESLISHLEALREAILKCLISLALVLPFAFFLAPKALNQLIKIIIGKNAITLNYFSPMEVFLIQIKTALVLSIIICFPYITKKLWNFILPALYENERAFIKYAVLTSSILFICGVIFCIFLILPFIIQFGMSFATSNMQAVFGISNIMNISLWLCVAFGLMFQMPLVTYWLIKSDIVSYEAISAGRRYVIVGILIISAILTPPDIISQVMLAIPTYALFELGLIFSRQSTKYSKSLTDSSSNALR